jgi:hypothetical protein
MSNAIDTTTPTMTARKLWYSGNAAYERWYSATGAEWEAIDRYSRACRGVGEHTCGRSTTYGWMHCRRVGVQQTHVDAEALEVEVDRRDEERRANEEDFRAKTARLGYCPDRVAHIPRAAIGRLGYVAWADNEARAEAYDRWMAAP